MNITGIKKTADHTAGYIYHEKAIESGGTRQVLLVTDWDSKAFNDFLNHLEEYLPQGKLIHKFRNSLTVMSNNDILGIRKDIVIKKFGLSRKYDKLRFRVFASKALRSFKIAINFIQNHLGTPRPIAIIEERGQFNRLLNCYYITEYLFYDYSLGNILNMGDCLFKEKIISALGKDIRSMHKAGIVHFDLNYNNILIKCDDDSPKFFYIDLNRARKRRCASIYYRIKDLSRLPFSKDHEIIFMKSYDPQHYQIMINLIHFHASLRKILHLIKTTVRKLKP